MLSQTRFFLLFGRIAPGRVFLIFIAPFATRDGYANYVSTVSPFCGTFSERDESDERERKNEWSDPHGLSLGTAVAGRRDMSNGIQKRVKAALRHLHKFDEVSL